MSTREQLLCDGVPAEFLDEVERFAPLDRWEFWFESGEWLTRVACPKCGASSDCKMDAVDDFWCDDVECGYDYVDDNEGMKPLPGSR